MIVSPLATDSVPSPFTGATAATAIVPWKSPEPAGVSASTTVSGVVSVFELTVTACVGFPCKLSSERGW